MSAAGRFAARPTGGTTAALVNPWLHVGVVVHVVAVGHLRRPAVPAPVVRDHAVAAPEEEHHLGIPVVGRERPAEAEDDRLARASVP